MTRLKVLKKARKLIKKFKHWTDGPLAVTKRGGQVNSNSKDAYARCALGALYAVVNCGRQSDFLEELLHEESKRLFDADLTDVNEDWTVSRRIRHKRVLKVYKAAIKTLS